MLVNLSPSGDGGRAQRALPRLVLGYMIKDRLGQTMYGTNTHLKELPLIDVRAGETVRLSFFFPSQPWPRKLFSRHCSREHRDASREQL